MHEILDCATAGYIKRHDPRYHFRSSPEKATICYLILPSQNARWEANLDEDSANAGYYHSESATSILVNRSSLDLTEEHQRRFARAMRKLALKPSVHPSQLQQELFATSTTGSRPSLKQGPHSASSKNVSEKHNEVRDHATTKRIKDLEQSQWPKLMLLSSHVFSEP